MISGIYIYIERETLYDRGRLYERRLKRWLSEIQENAFTHFVNE